MALSNVEIVRFITQDNGKLPFLNEGDYIISDDEIEWALSYSSNDVMKAARLVCHSITKWVSGISTKEIFGDVEMWNEVSKQYLKAVQAFLDDKALVTVIPKGLMPYAAGTSVADLAASYQDSDNPNRNSWLYNNRDVNEAWNNALEQAYGISYPFGRYNV